MSNNESRPKLDAQAAKDKLSQAAKDTLNKAVATLSWVDSFDCPECGRVCEQSSAPDKRVGAFYEGPGMERPTWYCERCEQHYRREDTDKDLTFDPFETPDNVFRKGEVEDRDYGMSFEQERRREKQRIDRIKRR